MLQEKTKVYIYTCVSTTMQIDGYSLDAQKARMKAYADFNDYQIVGEYEDASKLRCLGVFSVGFRCQQNTGTKITLPAIMVRRVLIFILFTHP